MPFVEGDSLENVEALREYVAIQRAVGRKDLPDPTTAGDFCRHFTLGHVLQVNRAFGEIDRRVYEQTRAKKLIQRGLKRKEPTSRPTMGEGLVEFRKAAHEPGPPPKRSLSVTV